MSSSRYIKKNILFSLLSIFINNLVKFINRTILLKYLPIVYVGYNGLFSNIISILSIAELGIGATIVYALYKPYSDGNHGKIKTYLKLYRKIYVYIFWLTLTIGVLISLFLNKIIKPEDFLEETYVIFYIFLINSCISYLFSYKSTILTVIKKGYYLNIIYIIFSIINLLINFFILRLTGSYIYFLISQLFINIITNFIILIISNNEGREILNSNSISLSKEELDNLKSNVFGNIFSKIASVIVLSTDNLLITYFINITTVALYTNYTMLITVVNSIISSFTSPIMSTVANMANNSSNEKDIEYLFNKHLYYNFIVNFFVSLMFFSTINSFIKIWLGHNFILENLTVIILSINLFMFNSRQTLFLFINIYGLYKYEKFKATLEVVFNILFSVIFVKYFNLGLSGILLGTLLSTLLSPILIEPIFVCRYVFNSSSIKFWKINYKYWLLFLSSFILIYYVNFIFINKIFSNNLINFVVITFINFFILILIIILFSINNIFFKELLIEINKKLKLY